MLGTYASLVVILGASAVVGQAVFGLCGRREWTPLSPAVGLAVVSALAWGGANIGGSALTGLLTVGLVAFLCAASLRRKLVGAAGAAIPTAIGAAFLASIPFLVEMRFGILGTSLNPDMSQHLFAADRIASGGDERLSLEGYPLGPHALVASVSELGPSLVHSFNGLTIATAVAASLAPLALLGRLSRGRQIGGALLVGFAYLAASYLIQGAFKETMQALFVLAFAVALAQLASGRLGGKAPARRWRVMRAVPLAALATGSLYAYSFPGLTWLVGATGIWALVEVARARGFAVIRPALPAAALALAALLAAAGPEIPRLAEFASFETFDPAGAGLGNLFNPISPIEALGIWPSGDFRLDAGAGFAPKLAFYAGGAVGALALLHGLGRAARNGEAALLAALIAGVLLYLYALLVGTPYQESKALAIAAPVAALLSVKGLLEVTPRVHQLRTVSGRALVLPAAALAFFAGSAGCTALALVNGPVGPTAWSPALTEFNAQLDDEIVIAVAEDELISDNGYDLVAWELRGREVCVVTQSEAAAGAIADQAFEAVVVIGEPEGPLPVVGRLEEVASEGDYTLYLGKLSGAEPQCPFIADGDRAEPGSE